MIENFSFLSFLPYIVFSLLLLSVFSMTISKDIIKVIVLLNLFSVLMAFSYLLLMAPDVALTESAIGACISSLFLLITCKHIKINTIASAKKPTFLEKIINFFCIVACATFAWYLICLVPYFPETNQITAPAYSENYIHYIGKSGQEIGIKEIVTSVLADYRGYDTLAETSVIVISGYIVFFLLSITEKTPKNTENFDQLLPVIMKLVIPIGICFLLYIQLNGEDSPGGGFQAGAIAASLVMAYQLFSSKVGFITQQNWLFSSAIGLAIYQITGFMCMNKQFLNYAALPLPNWINPHKCGIMIIELGIFITVFSVMVLIFNILRRRTYAS